MICCDIALAIPIAQEQHERGPQFLPHTNAASTQLVDLMATMLTADKPFAKVFTIVRQQVVAILAEPQASATHSIDAMVGIPATGRDPDAHREVARYRRSHA